MDSKNGNEHQKKVTVETIAAAASDNAHSMTIQEACKCAIVVRNLYLDAGFGAVPVAGDTR